MAKRQGGQGSGGVGLSEGLCLWGRPLPELPLELISIILVELRRVRYFKMMRSDDIRYSGSGDPKFIHIWLCNKLYVQYLKH